jgi:hypothetical protein
VPQACTGRGTVKKPSRRRFLRLAASAAALPATSRLALAQTYSARPVRLISSFAAGGPNDLLARLIGQWLSERYGACRLSRLGARAHRPPCRPGPGHIRQRAQFDRIHPGRPAARARDHHRDAPGGSARISRPWAKPSRATRRAPWPASARP